MKIPLLLFIFFVSITFCYAQKPKVWIFSDMSNKALKGSNKEGTVNDPDDISTMAGYLLMCNDFNTLGIVISSTHRKELRNAPNQAEWAKKYFGSAYRHDVMNLNKNIGGYPDSITFMQSYIKNTAEHFDPDKTYKNIQKYSTVNALFKTAEKTKGIINVLVWCSLTEPAILVKHCLSTDRIDILKKLRFIAHWTNSSLYQGTPEHPEDVANCREDAKACIFMKAEAAAHNIEYYELGAIGQSGIVGGAPTGKKYYDQFRVSKLGTILVDGKYAYKRIDFSDSATYWTLLGKWGVNLKNVRNDGTNPPGVERANERKYRNWSKRIYDELLRRARAAAN